MMDYIIMIVVWYFLFIKWNVCYVILLYNIFYCKIGYENIELVFSICWEVFDIEFDLDVCLMNMKKYV